MDREIAEALVVGDHKGTLGCPLLAGSGIWSSKALSPVEESFYVKSSMLAVKICI